MKLKFGDRFHRVVGLCAHVQLINIGRLVIGGSILSVWYIRVFTEEFKFQKLIQMCSQVFQDSCFHTRGGVSLVG